MEDAFVVYGGKKLAGTVQISGAKNIALKVLTSSLLFNDKVILNNIPRIRDVFEVMNLINALGATAEFIEKNTVMIDPSTLKEKTLDLLFASKIRTSFMFFAPLLHAFKECFIPNPGGCRLGARPIDRIIDGLKALSVEVEYNSETGFFHAKLPVLPHGTFRFPKISHTGTELLVMMAVLSDQTSVIENAALEPEIDDLISFFNEAGAKIRREGTSIIVDGVAELKQQKPYTIAGDRNEAVTYAVLALTTQGDITLEGIPVHLVEKFDRVLDEMGAGIEKKSDTSIRYFYKGPLKAMSIETGPHPGFMTDWQPPMAVLLTQAAGESMIHEKLFENRFSYVSELKKLGADIEYANPEVPNPKEFYEFNYEEGQTYQQAITIKGPQKLHNGVMNIADLRAGATLAIAALIAPGESIVNGASHMERGYEDFASKVTALGGDIAKA